MKARSLLLCTLALGMALGAAPANASRRCGNALADGRFIVQGPLVDERGEFCALAVVPRVPGNFTDLVVIDGAQFADEIIVLAPPFARHPHRMMVVERREFQRPQEPAVPTIRFNTGSIGPFTTGTIGPLVTFSNTPPARPGHR